MHCKKEDKPRMLTRFHIVTYIMDLGMGTYLDDLLSLLGREESIKDFAAYVDDLYIFISGNNFKELEIKASTTE
jgi:ornithine carbamoyltransferase